MLEENNKCVDYESKFSEGLQEEISYLKSQIESQNKDIQDLKEDHEKKLNDSCIERKKYETQLINQINSLTSIQNENQVQYQNQINEIHIQFEKNNKKVVDLERENSELRI